MAPPPLDTQFDSKTNIWYGPPEDHDKSLQLGAYLLNVLKTAANPEKIVQVGLCAAYPYIITCYSNSSFRRYFTIQAKK